MALRGLHSCRRRVSGGAVIFADVFEDDSDRDPTPENSDEWQCSECGDPTDLAPIHDFDEFGGMSEYWICASCRHRIEQRRPPRG